MKYFLIAISLSTCFFSSMSCRKDREDLNTMSLTPNVLYYQFSKNDVFLKDSALQDVAMFYLKNGDTINAVPWQNLDAYGTPLIQMVRAEFSEPYNHGVCYTVFIDGYLKEGNNTFYFKFPNGNIDTLYLENQDVGNEEGKKFDCYCRYPLTTVLYNGKPAAINPNLKAPSGKPIFIFNKN